MDYNGLKRILGEIFQYKQSRQPSTPLRSIHHKLTLHGPFSGLNLQSTNLSSKEDIEDQVIDVNASPQDGSRKFYMIQFLRESEEGGELEVKFFRKLDEQLNKVNTFYKDKLEGMKHEASLLNKQMDALIALRVKVENPDFDGSDAKKSCDTRVVTTNPLKCCSPSRDISSGETCRFFSWQTILPASLIASGPSNKEYRAVHLLLWFGEILQEAKQMS